MTRLRITLLGDGSSDRVLLHPLQWLLRSNGVQLPLEPRWAEFGGLPDSRRSLTQRIAWAIRDFPCELLFIHRDAEKEDRRVRLTEICCALEQMTWEAPPGAVPSVCVVPVRMTEAWFLFDESAIRRVAGNPKSTAPLDLPRMARVEALHNPKELLHDILRRASGHSGRRLRKFRPVEAVHDLAARITDYAPLRQLEGFAALERDVQEVVNTAGKRWRL